MLKRVRNNDNNSDLNARKRVQSVIKGWLSTLEKSKDWESISSELQQSIRRSIIRASWTSYKIGLFTNFEHNQQNQVE